MLITILQSSLRIVHTGACCSHHSSSAQELHFVSASESRHGTLLSSTKLRYPQQCSAVQESVRLIEGEEGPALLQLADQCRTALARAGFNVGPRGYDSKDRSGDADRRCIPAAGTNPCSGGLQGVKF